MKIICGTGHRPNKLGGYDSKVLTRLVDCAEAYLVKAQPDKVIAGGALGWDTALAIASIRLHIPLTLAIPFQDFPDKWKEADRKRFYKILDKASEWVLVDDTTNPKYAVTSVSVGSYHVSKLQKRNMWMVDNATHIVAMHDGSSGGTKNCLVYNANTKRLPVDNMWRNWCKYSGI